MPRHAGIRLGQSMRPAGACLCVHRSKRGVTLLELMLTVSIGIILATLAGSELRQVLIHSRERAAAQEVVNVLQSARSQARSHRTPVTVTVNNRKFEVKDSIDGTQTYPFSKDLFKVTLGTSNTLTYNELGGITSDQPISVAIVSPSGAQRGLRIYPAIGSVREVSP